MITIIDYGLGNIRAFANLYEKLNIQTRIARQASDLDGATKIILPGVGAFDHAMTLLNSSGMRDDLERLVIENSVPVLGICVGMQILAKSSEEGIMPGLGWLNGKVRRFDSATIPYKTRLPHMGWNTIANVKSNPLLLGLNESSRFYFLHSYYFQAQENEDVIAMTEYGINFCCAVSYKNISGVQFHPEKSHSNGVKLLYNFANL